jgi:hypothetical protein
MGLRDILTFRRDWSEDAVMQFYATCQFRGEAPRTLEWMTLGAHLSVTFEEFASILKIPIDDSLDRIHSMSDMNESMNASALKPLHLNGVDIRDPHSTSTLQPLYFFMFKIITKVLVPKIGDRDNVRSYAVDLLVRMHTHGNVRFDLADFLFNQIRLASFEQDRSFPYAPFIQALIDDRFKRGKIYKDAKHNMWTPKASISGEVITVPRQSKRNIIPTVKLPSKFEIFLAKTQRMLFQICSSNAEEIANIKTVDRAKINKYKARVRQLGGEASDDEVIASSSTATPKYTFPTKGYEEFFDDDANDEAGGSGSGGNK